MDRRRLESAQTATEYVIVFAVLALLMLMTLDAWIYPALVIGQNGFNENLQEEINRGNSGDATDKR